MHMKKGSLVLFCVLLLLELPGLPSCRAAAEGVQLELSADAASIPAWGSCNLTARLTQDGAPLANVDITWNVSGGVAESNHSVTDSSGYATVPVTAVVSAIHGTSGTVNVSARATVGGTDYSAQTSIVIESAPVEWTGEVDYRASAGELYPGETLKVEVNIDQPTGKKYNYIANFKVEADLLDSSQTIVNTVVLGNGLSLTPGMQWSSGEQVLFQVPQNPATFSYLWTFYILTPDGTYTYYQPDDMIPVKILLTGKDDWTFLLYIDGDNNLNGSAKTYFNNIERTAAGNLLTVLIQLDLPGKDTTRWKLQYDTDMGAINSLLLGTMPNVDSGNSKTLYDFLAWGADYAPAGHYCVDLWDHGGSYYGTCWDYTSNSELWNKQLSEALGLFATHYRKIDVLVFDACLMSSYETIYRFMDVANYMVGNEVPGFACLPVFSPGALLRLEMDYIFSRPTPRQVAQEIIQGYVDSNGYTEPVTATDLAAAHAALDDIDALGNSLADNWKSVRKWMMEARSDTVIFEGPLGGLQDLVDTRTFFQELENMLATDPVKFAAPLSILNKLLNTDENAMRVAWVPVVNPYKSFLPTIDSQGYNILMPPDTKCYTDTRDAYVYSGLPETHGWVRLLDKLFLPYKAQSGNQIVYPAHLNYNSYPVESSNLLKSDSNGDGLYEAVSADFICNQTGNSGNVTVIVDLMAYNGSQGASISGLADRKVFNVHAGAYETENITLTSPVKDLADVALTVLTDSGDVLEQMHLGMVMMNATPRSGDPPTLNISVSNTSVTEGQRVNFTADTASPQGAPVTVWWNFDDRNGAGIDATGPEASVTYRGALNRTITCIATDGTHFTVRSLNVTVLPDAANRQPVAALASIFLDPKNPLKATFNASKSYDQDGEPVDFLFDFGDGNDTGWVASPVVEHEYAAAGNFDCEVLVRDHTAYNGSHAVVTVMPGITPVSLPPVPVLRISANKIKVSQTVTLDASGSSDPQGSPLQFQISWGDGNATGWASSANTSHIYTRAGNYTVTLTVRNGLDLSGTATSTILASAKPKTATAKGFIPGPTVALAIVTIGIASALTRKRK